METAQLSGQVMIALAGGSLLLSLIGIRTLVESLINTKYTFDYPGKGDPVSWSASICEDYLKRGNDPKAMKSKLHEKAIKARAQEVELEELYDKTYASLCNYTHLHIHTSTLNNPQYFAAFTQNAFVEVLSLERDVRDAIQDHFNIKGWRLLDERIKQFRDNHRTEETTEG